MGMTASMEKLSNLAVARDHIQYDPWIGSVDLTGEEIEWDGMVLGVEKERVYSNRFYRCSHRFVCPGQS